MKPITLFCRLLSGLLASGITLSAAPALAQDFPNQPIRIVVPNAAGSASDNVARIVGAELSKQLKVPVIVDNKVGADGRIAAKFVATAPPDGYTLLMGTNSAYAINPVAFKDLNYNPVKDFVAIAPTYASHYVFAVPVSSRFTSVKDFIAQAKARPNQLNMGGGVSSAKLATGAFASMAGIDVTYVSYKAVPPALQDLLAGRIDAMIMDLSSALPHIRNGNLRALASGGQRRISVLPDVPTMIESGLPQFQMNTWAIFFGPTGIPKPTMDKLSLAFKTAISTPEITTRLLGTAGGGAGNGNDMMLLSQEETQAFVLQDAVKWADFAKRAGYVPE